MDEEPLVRVVRGTPTAEELAALVGMLASRWRPAGGTASRPSPAASAWARSARPGRSAGGWRASALPR